MSELVPAAAPAPPPRLPMTAGELTALVELVVAYSEREPDENMLNVWGTQATMGRWTFAEASRALHAWYHRHPEGQDYLKPKIIADLIRAARQDQAMRAETERARERAAAVEDAREQRAGDPGQRGRPSTDEFRRQMIAGIAADLGWNATVDEGGDPDLRETALAVACDWEPCRSPVGEFCHVPSRRHGDRRLTKRGAHPSRVAALRALQAAQAAQAEAGARS